MRIIRVSVFTGITRERDIDITEDQLERWKKGELIQNVVPHLNEEDREFILTGITEEEWDNYMNNE